MMASTGISFFFNDTATTEIYTLSLHDALPISCSGGPTQSKRFGVHYGALCSRQDRPSHRPALSIEGRSGSAPVCGRRTCPRKSSHHCLNFKTQEKLRHLLASHQ